MTTADEKILNTDLFAGDFGEPGDRSLSNKMVVAAKQHHCGHCKGPIAKGERHRSFTEIFDGELFNGRLCAECCSACVADWDNDGIEHMEARIDLHDPSSPYSAMREAADAKTASSPRPLAARVDRRRAKPMTDLMTDALSITIGRTRVPRFFHSGMKGKGGYYIRCIACGQIDEDGYHAAEYCPAIGIQPKGRYGVVSDPANLGAWQVRAPEGFLVFTTETCGPQTLLQAQRVAATSNAELDKKAAIMEARK